MARASIGPTTFGGQRWPDIVGALHVKQGWGEAQVSGVIHNVNVRDYNYFQTASCGVTGLATCEAQQGKVGWGVDAGVKFNLTNGGWFGGWWGAGDDIIVHRLLHPERSVVFGYTGRHEW